MLTFNAPVMEPICNSSHPIDGGLSQGSLSMSYPDAYKLLPAPLQGDANAK